MKIGVVIVCLMMVLFVEGCRSCGGFAGSGKNEAELPRLKRMGTLHVREFVDTGSPILILDKRGASFASLSTNELSASDFTFMREQMSRNGSGVRPYCTVFCDKNQTVGTLESRIMRHMLPVDRTGILGVGLVAVTGNFLINQRVVLDLQFIIKDTGVTNSLFEKMEDPSVVIVRVNRNVVADNTKKWGSVEVLDDGRVVNILVEIVDPTLTVQQLVTFVGRNPLLRTALFVFRPDAARTKVAVPLPPLPPANK